jgi:hypothetical protein
MMRRASTIGGIAAATLLLATPVFAAGGLRIVEQTTSGGKTETHKILLDQNRMRAETGGGDGSQVVIFDGTQQVLRILDMNRKSYMELTKADAERLGSQMNAAMAEMQSRLQNLPPDQRARIEAMMRGRGMGAPAAEPAKPEYRKAGTGKVGSWTCDKYDGYENGKKTSEVCTVDPKTLGFTLDDFAVTRQMADFFQSIVPAQMRRQTNLFAIGDASKQGFAGVPVGGTMYDDSGNVTSTTEVTEVSRQTFTDATFAVPDGFTKRDMPMMGGRGGGR